MAEIDDVEDQVTAIIIEHTTEWFQLRLEHEGSAIEAETVANDIEDCAAEISGVLRAREFLTVPAETEEDEQDEI